MVKQEQIYNKAIAFYMFLWCIHCFQWMSDLQETVVFIWWWLLFGLVARVFVNGPGDLGSVPGRVIPKTLRMVLDTSLLNIQQYKVCVEGKVEQSRERSSALPYTLVY